MKCIQVILCNPPSKELVFLIDDNWKVGEIWDDDLGNVERTVKTFYEYICDVIGCLYEAKKKKN